MRCSLLLPVVHLQGRGGHCSLSSICRDEGTLLPLSAASSFAFWTLSATSCRSRRLLLSENVWLSNVVRGVEGGQLERERETEREGEREGEEGRGCQGRDVLYRRREGAQGEERGRHNGEREVWTRRGDGRRSEHKHRAKCAGATWSVIRGVMRSSLVLTGTTCSLTKEDIVYRLNKQQEALMHAILKKDSVPFICTYRESACSHRKFSSCREL